MFLKHLTITVVSALNLFIVFSSGEINKQDYFPFHDEFQYIVDYMIEDKAIVIDESHMESFELPSQKSVVGLFKKMIKEKDIVYNRIYVGEDNSGTLWYVATQMENAYRKNVVALIVRKSDAKVFVFETLH